LLLLVVDALWYGVIDALRLGTGPSLFCQMTDVISTAMSAAQAEVRRLEDVVIETVQVFA
jgi:hypothetical protein